MEATLKVQSRSKKKYRRLAELAATYGAGVLPRERVEVDGVLIDRIPRDLEIGLQFLIPSIEAQRTIASGKYNTRDPGYVYSLFMLAYDNKQVASDAKLNALKNLVDESCGDKR